MLVNLIPEFLSTLSAADRSAAYHEYLDRHRPILGAYWQNYVLDPESPHAEPIIENALRADRSDLKRLLEDVDVVAIAEDGLRRATEILEADCPVDLYLMVGVGAANAGELVVGGRGVAFVCLEHFTGRANAQTYSMGLGPQLLPLWIAHEVAHTLRYTSPSSRAALRRLVDELGGYYDGWELGSRATLRELVVFLRRAAANDLDSSGLGLRLRYLSGGTSPAARLVAGKVLPERSGYYLGWRLVENYLGEHGAASTVRAAVEELRQADDRASGIQTA